MESGSRPATALMIPAAHSGQDRIQRSVPFGLQQACIRPRSRPWRPESAQAIRFPDQGSRKSARRRGATTIISVTRSTAASDVARRGTAGPDLACYAHYTQVLVRRNAGARRIVGLDASLFPMKGIVPRIT